MPIIQLKTVIKADIQRCFDLLRSIDLHQISTAHSNETAIDGVTKGLIGLGEFVTWEATHFGVRQRLSSKITAYTSPIHFRDEQIKGIFKYMKHDHFFETQGEVTVMKDTFEYASPLGFLGVIADFLFVERYLKNLLNTRNNIIKNFAETDDWKKVL